MTASHWLTVSFEVWAGTCTLSQRLGLLFGSKPGESQPRAAPSLGRVELGLSPTITPGF